jgi:hypothetical protein
MKYGDSAFNAPGSRTFIATVHIALKAFRKIKDRANSV